MLAHEDRLLDLGLLDVAVLAHLDDALAVLRGDHLVVLHLLHLLSNLVVVPLLQLHHLRRALPRLLDLLPRLQLLLLEESDAVGEQLRIALDTKQE